MILSFGADSAGLAPMALALTLPSVAALVCYLGAALPSERLRARLRTALLLGWIAHGLALVDRHRRHRLGRSRGALRLRAGAVAHALAGAGGLPAREPDAAAARRAPRARRAAARWSSSSPGSIPGRVHPQAIRSWAPLHWLLGIASYGLFGVAVLHALLLEPRRAADAAGTAGAGAGGRGRAAASPRAADLPLRRRRLHRPARR